MRRLAKILSAIMIQILILSIPLHYVNAASNNVIQSINLYVDQPIVGETLDYSPSYRESHWYLSDFHWVIRSIGSQPSEWTIVQAGKNYQPCYYVTAENGYIINNNTRFYINGQLATYDSRLGIVEGPIMSSVEGINQVGFSIPYPTAVDKCSECTDVTSNDADKYTGESSWSHYNESTGKYDNVAPEDTFIPGDKYRCSIFVRPKDGYGVLHTGTATVNGETAEYGYDPLGKYLYVYWDYEIKPLITNVAITIDEPVAGDTADKHIPVLTGDNNCYISNNIFAWGSYDVNNNTTQHAVFSTSTATFTADNYYSMQINLKAYNGYAFSPDVSVTVNGNIYNVTLTKSKKSGYVVYQTDILEPAPPPYVSQWHSEIDVFGKTNWYYYDSTGNKYIGWLYYKNNWYYLNPAMYTGKALIGSDYYFFNASGVMQTGWCYYEDHWYYCNSNGQPVKGWLKINNTWYYMDSSYGDMTVGWKSIWVNNVGVRDFYFDSTGAMVIGWKKIDGTWYYFNNSGYKQVGWIKYQGSWYYLNVYGEMQTGWVKYYDTWYYCNNSGVMQTGWKNINGTWYYFNASGEMLTGWKYINNNWYYFNSNGAMLHDTVIDGYTLSSSGAMI